MPIAQSEFIVLLAKLIQPREIDQGIDHRTRFHLVGGIHIPRTEIEDRISARVERSSALKRHSDVQFITRRFAGIQIEEVNVAIHGCEDDLDQVGFLLGPVIHVHQLLDVIRPLYNQRLANPSAARPCIGRFPADIAARQFAGINRPCLGEFLAADRRGSKRSIVAVVVTAERDDARRVGIGHVGQKLNRIDPLIAVDLGSVDLDCRGQSIDARLRAVYRMRNIIWRRRRRRRRRGGRRRGRRRRRFKDLGKQTWLLACFGTLRRAV
ncbi:hypothetical protein SDC9_129195 [bioreactor metagenome]|uniref:Uncharacterized protein n=1 Tax=bioreactor metagenome TaxID=1076179 RepID=A0A645CY97_9ZZZZ